MFPPRTTLSLDRRLHAHLRAARDHDPLRQSHLPIDDHSNVAQR